MATAVKILDRHRFEARARILDVLAIGLLLVVGFSLMVVFYRLGYTAGEAVRTGGQAVLDRDALFAVAIAEGAVAVACVSWLAYRVFTSGSRQHGG